jgi:hypothetical protein
LALINKTINDCRSRQLLQCSGTSPRKYALARMFWRAMRDKHMDNLELASIALSTPEIRKASAAYERLFSALHLLDTLPLRVLVVLDEQITKEYKDKRGPLADFLKCYLAYLKETEAEAKMRDRRLRFGIGTLEDYLLPPTTAERTDEVKK